MRFSNISDAEEELGRGDERKLYFAQVETKEPENECQGLILLHHMERRGPNQLVWARRRIS